MKISLNWLKEFTDIKVSIDELVTKIGAQLGAVEEVINLGDRYKGVVVAKVVSCHKHPDADKLSVCKIDDNGGTPNVARDEQGLVQVVCGAPNVREGLLVAWLPPGVIVPSTYDKEQFRLEARELRGVVSNGMLASGQELAINDDHTGIVELENTKPGEAIADVLLLNDYIIDIENKMFTHRPDCFGILGVAREIAGIQHHAFESPDWYVDTLPVNQEGAALPLVIKNEAPELVPRFMAVAMDCVNVGPSPLLMQSFLSRVGLKPINNIVDITNFVMVLTGQPLHAYDYDKVKDRSGATPTLIARKAYKQEGINLLNGKRVAFDDPAIVIATDKEPIGVGGIMGGSDTEVDESTTRIILECANFDMYAIRKTSMKYGLFTDAVSRFNKGQSPLQNDKVLAYACKFVSDIADGTVASKVLDVKHKLREHQEVVLDAAFVNERLGLDLTTEQMAKLLNNVEFEIGAGKELSVTAPFWRTDIEIAEDVVEEVGRLYGFDHLPLELPKRDLTPTEKNSLLEFKSRVRDVLADAGANEVLTYSFVHSNLLEKVGQDQELAYQLSNALSPDLQYYRLSLLPSLLEKVHPNIKAGFESFAIFEINKSHDKSNVHEDNLPIEEERIAFVYATDAKIAKNLDGAPYYQARHYVEHLLSSLGMPVEFRPIKHLPQNDTGKQALKPFDHARTAYVTSNGKLLGLVGEFTAKARKALKLPTFAAGFELDMLMLEQYQQLQSYTPLSRYPRTEQDISLKVDAAISYGELAELVQKVLLDAQKTHGYTSQLLPLDIYQAEDAKTKHIAFRIVLTHFERTLVTEEVNKLLDTIASEAHGKLNVTRL